MRTPGSRVDIGLGHCMHLMPSAEVILDPRPVGKLRAQAGCGQKNLGRGEQKRHPDTKAKDDWLRDEERSKK